MPSTTSLIKAFMNPSRNYILFSDDVKSIKRNWEKAIYSKNYKKIQNTNVENWEYNVRMMKAISSAIGSEYFVFLQPTMGINDDQIPKNKLSNDGKIYKKTYENNKDYLVDIKNRYKKLSEVCKKLEYCIDISNKVSPTGNLYNDVRHHNENGNKLLAEVIFNYLKLK